MRAERQNSFRTNLDVGAENSGENHGFCVSEKFCAFVGIFVPVFCVAK